MGEVEKQGRAVAQAQLFSPELQKLQLGSGHPDPAQHSRQTLPLCAGVKAHPAPHRAGDARQEFKAGKAQLHHGPGQAGQAHPRAHPQRLVLLLQLLQRPGEV